MTALQLPCTIFQTRHRMNDYGARDMRYGDLSAQQLQHQYHLENISAKVDPYRLKKRLPFTPSQYQFGNHYHSEEDISLQQCARILFDEFRGEARLFAFHSPYRHLITAMINHMQYKNGTPFKHMILDQAFTRQIIEDNSAQSTRSAIKGTLREHIDWSSNIFKTADLSLFRSAILRCRLPKFTSIKSMTNGMAIAIHDTWATHIIMEELKIANNRYQATIQYRIQDHFGLDDDDIVKHRHDPINIFKIWYLLQHYNRFGFKPFIVNINAKIKISGHHHGKS